MKNMVALAQSRDKVGNVVIQAIMDIENCFANINVEVYLYDSMSNTFNRCSREFGDVIKDESKTAFRKEHDRQLNQVISIQFYFILFPRVW